MPQIEELPLRVGREVAAGFNPMAPQKDEAVLCWGEKCEGNFGSSFGSGSRCRRVHAISCACMRKQMNWMIEG